MNIWRKLVAELIGTFGLTLVVIITLATNTAQTPYLASLTLAVMVFSLGAVSGAHLNPAITIASLSIGKTPFKHAIFYILAQLIGAFVALLMSLYIVEDIPTKLADAVGGKLGFDLRIGIAEVIGTFFLAFGIASVVQKKSPEAASGLVVGGSLLLGILIASTIGSNGMLNPAIALMSGSVSLMYFIGPLVGAVAGMWMYKMASA